MRGSVPPCVSRARVETSGDAELPRKRWGNGSRAAAMRSRHRASVSPGFGQGGGVEPYRSSETYFGEQATLGQELGDVGGKHDVSVDGGRGGSEVSGEPISKGYAAGTVRDPEARERGKRAGGDVATRADRYARARTRILRVLSTPHDSDIAQGIAVVPVASTGEPHAKLARERRSSRAANQIAHRSARENVARGCARTCTRRHHRNTSRSTGSAAYCAVLEVSGWSCRTQWPRTRRRHALAQTILSHAHPSNTLSAQPTTSKMFLCTFTMVIWAITLSPKKTRFSRGKNAQSVTAAFVTRN